LSRTLNLGILAHVDAGKTSLTGRLLHTVGVIDEIGSVDDGSTRTVEQAIATLKSWRLLRKLRCSTTRITSLVQAVLVLQLAATG
jgi:peptide subunit release factor RF-3